jgi:hypothetical protein
MKTKIISLSILLTTSLNLFAQESSHQEWEEIQSIISPYFGEWNDASYEGLFTTRVPHTALMGNGDVGIASGGSATSKTFYVSKGDFWAYNGSPVPIGGITIRRSTGAGNPSSGARSLHEVQDILNAEVRTNFVDNNLKLEMRSFMSATYNLFVIELSSKSEAEIDLTAVLWAKADNSSYPFTRAAGSGGVSVSRSTPNSYQTTISHTSKAVLSSKIIGASFTTAVGDAAGEANMRFSLAPNQTAYIVVAIGGGGRTYNGNGLLIAENPDSQATDILSKVSDEADIKALLSSHREWWKRYWTASYLRLDVSDHRLNTIMKFYYAAQYVLACNIRTGKVAPGLYGLWHTTDNPSWSSDYHLNYNFISTFYGVNSSNRPEQSLPAIDAILQYLPQGKTNASSVAELRKIYESFVNTKIQKGSIDAQNGIPDAILYPVALGPWGMNIDHGYYRQTLDATFSAHPLIAYYHYTQNEDFLRDTLYDYLKLCVAFFEKWLELENERYVLYAGFNEGSWSMNPAVELAMLKNVLSNLISAAQLLNRDADKLPFWQDLLRKLPRQPIATYQGKTVYTLAEKEWKNNLFEAMTDPIPWDGNILPMEQVFPGEQLGHFSQEAYLNIAKNTIDVFATKGAWTQMNNFPKIYNIAANVRYPIETIIDNFVNTITRQMQANLTIDDETHGVEKSGAVEAVNTMMLLSNQGIIKVFPSWSPINRDAKFVRLRQKGAFLLSSEYSAQENEVLYIDLQSEAGKSATIASPWGKNKPEIKDETGKSIDFIPSFAPNYTDDLNELTFTFPTQKGTRYHITKSTTIFSENELNTLTSITTTKTSPLTIYPNPSTAGDTFYVDTKTEETGTIELYTLLGQLLYQTKITQPITKIHLPNLQSGIYLIIFKPTSSKTRTQTTKLIVNN